VTRSSLAESTPDRDATTFAFSGGSPPSGKETYPAGSTVCRLNHDLTATDSTFTTRTGRLMCVACRRIYAANLQAKHNDPVYRAAVAESIAAGKRARAAEVAERREAKRVGYDLLEAARKAARGRSPRRRRRA
jgi:hypothetical protein